MSTKSTDKKTAVIQVAKRHKDGRDPDSVYQLSTGVKARLKPVSAALIDEVVGKIEDPPVPMFFNEDKGRKEPNEFHPDYLKDKRKAERQRVTAAIDAMVMFGMELVDGVPDPSENGWMKKLRYMEKRGLLDLSDYDLDDDLDQEFLYKRFIAMGAEDMVMISDISGVSPEEVDRELASFPDQEEQAAD